MGRPPSLVRRLDLSALPPTGYHLLTLGPGSSVLQPIRAQASPVWWDLGGAVGCKRWRPLAVGVATVLQVSLAFTGSEVTAVDAPTAVSQTFASYASFR